jgi:hypothetical protein
MTSPPCPPGAALIRLSNGEFTIVDEEDYEELATLTWHHGDEGYVVHTVGMGGKTYQLLMHRVVLRAAPDVLVDHRDGNRLDNRKDNLRSASHRQNAQNRAPIAGRRWKGVYAAGDRWKARIKHDGRMIHLGAYESEEIAALAYDLAARQLFGAFARLNFPEQVP